LIGPPKGYCQVSGVSRGCKLAVAVFKQLLANVHSRYGRYLTSNRSSLSSRERTVSDLSGASALSGHLTFFTEPKLKWDRAVYGPKFAKIHHHGGDFKIAFYGLVLRNSTSKRSKIARNCKLLLTDKDSRITPIFWLNVRRETSGYKIPYGLDTNSPDIEKQVMEALVKIGFCKEQTDISRGMHEIAFVAFGLELDNRIYFATNPPTPIELRFLSQQNAFSPFSVLAEGEEISLVKSSVATVHPGVWRDFKIMFASRLTFLRKLSWRLRRAS